MHPTIAGLSANARLVVKQDTCSTAFLNNAVRDWRNLDRRRNFILGMSAKRWVPYYSAICSAFHCKAARLCVFH